MSAVFQITLVAVACGLSAVGGLLLKHAAENTSVWMLAASLTLYSLSSLTIFAIYRSGAGSYALVNFALLLGTLICVQLIASLWLNEPINIRAIAVLVLAIIGISWAAASPASTPDRHPSDAPFSIGASSALRRGTTHEHN